MHRHENRNTFGYSMFFFSFVFVFFIFFSSLFLTFFSHYFPFFFPLCSFSFSVVVFLPYFCFCFIGISTLIAALMGKNREMIIATYRDIFFLLFFPIFSSLFFSSQICRFFPVFFFTRSLLIFFSIFSCVAFSLFVF